MKICHCDQKIHHHDLKFITLVIWGPYTNVINFTFLSLVVFGSFHTFLDGWVVGWVG